MITIKGKDIIGAYYDINIGYYCEWKSRHYFPDLEPIERLGALDDDAKTTQIALHRFYRPGVSIFINDKYILDTQFTANSAPFAPLIKNQKRDLRVFAFFPLFSIFNLCFFG